MSNKLYLCGCKPETLFHWHASSIVGDPLQHFWFPLIRDIDVLLFLHFLHQSFLAASKWHYILGLEHPPHTSHILPHGEPVVPLILHSFTVNFHVELSCSFLLLSDSLTVSPIVISFPLSLLPQLCHDLSAGCAALHFFRIPC